MPGGARWALFAMSKVVHTVDMRIERIERPQAPAWLPARAGPRGGSTAALDAVVADVGASLTEAFAGALEAGGIGVGAEALTASVRGEVEPEHDGVLAIKRIRVTYHVRAGEEHRETVERVHASHAAKCPVYRSVSSSIDITTKYELTAD